MTPYKSKFQEGDPYLDRNPDEPWVLPPRSQAAGREDISQWSDEKAKLEIEKLKMYISRLRTRGDDSSIQDEIRTTYRKIRHIEEVKWPEKAAKKKASAAKASNKAYHKRLSDKEKKVNDEAEAFNSFSDKQQAEQAFWEIANRIRFIQDQILSTKRDRWGTGKFKTENIERLRKEEEQAVQFRTEFKQLFPGIEPKRRLSYNSLDSLKDKIKNKKLKDFFGKYRAWIEKKDRL
jgi:hypothetical protein